MKLVLQGYKRAFSGYTPSLEALENSFCKAGLKIGFWADRSLSGEKKVHIEKDGRFIKTVYIEGDSPAQAVKDVAAAIRL